MPRECGLNLSWILKESYGLPRLREVTGRSRQRVEPEERQRDMRSGVLEDMCQEVL